MNGPFFKEKEQSSLFSATNLNSLFYGSREKIGILEELLRIKKLKNQKIQEVENNKKIAGLAIIAINLLSEICVAFITLVLVILTLPFPFLVGNLLYIAGKIPVFLASQAVLLVAQFVVGEIKKKEWQIIVDPVIKEEEKFAVEFKRLHKGPLEKKLNEINKLQLKYNFTVGDEKPLEQIIQDFINQHLKKTKIYLDATGKPKSLNPQDILKANLHNYLEKNIEASSKVTKVKNTIVNGIVSGVASLKGSMVFGVTTKIGDDISSKVEVVAKPTWQVYLDEALVGVGVFPEFQQEYVNYLNESLVKGDLNELDNLLKNPIDKNGNRINCSFSSDGFLSFLSENLAELSYREVEIEANERAIDSKIQQDEAQLLRQKEIREKCAKRVDEILKGTNRRDDLARELARVKLQKLDPKDLIRQKVAWLKGLKIALFALELAVVLASTIVAIVIPFNPVAYLGILLGTVFVCFLLGVARKVVENEISKRIERTINDVRYEEEAVVEIIGEHLNKELAETINVNNLCKGQQQKTLVALIQDVINNNQLRSSVTPEIMVRASLTEFLATALEKGPNKNIFVEKEKFAFTAAYTDRLYNAFLASNLAEFSSLLAAPEYSDSHGKTLSQLNNFNLTGFLDVVVKSLGSIIYDDLNNEANKKMTVSTETQPTASWICKAFNTKEILSFLKIGSEKVKPEKKIGSSPVEKKERKKTPRITGQDVELITYKDGLK